MVKYISIFFEGLLPDILKTYKAQWALMGLGRAQVFVQAPFDDVPMNNILKSNPFGL